MPNLIKPVKKNQVVKQVCINFNAELISLIDKNVKEQGITRTQWLQKAAKYKLKTEK